MTSLLSVSAFFPCYNDGGTIARVVILADKTLQEVVDDYEIIVVDDGSTDQSVGVLEELLRSSSVPLRLVRHPRNRGYGGRSAPASQRPPKTGSSTRTATRSTTCRSYESCWRSSMMASMWCRDTSSSARIRGIGY